jgi:RNA polymerase sigma-70 factor (ECF subfamily)
MSSDPALSRPDDPRPPAAFPATRWTLVDQLRGGTEEESARALNDLCRRYWYPIFAMLRHTGRTAHDAEDLTQSFFASLLADHTLHQADPGRGRLRSFLLGALKRFLADETRHRTALKRGGGITHLSLGTAGAEQRYLAEPVDDRDPEKLYLQAWVHNLVDRVREKLRAGFAGAGDAEKYAVLAPFIEGEAVPVSFRELGGLLGQTESGARVTVFRLRLRFRELLTEAVRQTVESPGEAAGELDWVLAILREQAKS